MYNHCTVIQTKTLLDFLNYDGGLIVVGDNLYSKGIEASISNYRKGCWWMF